jgi:hypothetical protein
MFRIVLICSFGIAIPWGPVLAHAAPPNLHKYVGAEGSKVMANGEIADSLQKLMGARYERFIDNFEVTEVPGRIDSDGSLVVTGFARHLHMQYRSILVLKPDGRIYAALLDVDKIQSFTNDPAFKRALYPPINVWRSDLPNIPVEFD